eukprot:comp7215_c0_seq1/m.2925 comp7215_c0_seq1/g.2925  ORF comp7215_c0_seq1/g.2925 comp7215_c0_seq1/m.2925 type:complete len:374 (-) comp7215_c0_seq1:224-1345(-)
MLIEGVSWGRIHHVLSALKLADWMVLSFALATFPLLFVGGRIIWGGLILRLFMFPSVVYGRHYFASTPADKLSGEIKEFRLFNGNLVLLFSFPVVLSSLLDFYSLIACFYFYAEDGTILSNLYPNNPDYMLFWDDALKNVDAQLFGIDVEVGVGAYLRSLTPPVFNKFFGEYLHFCYFFFYIILGGTYLFSWLFCYREHFDRIASAEVLAYIVCLSWYLIQPAAGPYWTYTHTEAGDVGWFFSSFVHAVVNGGSSKGTAFPSGHCAITAAAWVGAALYMQPVAVAYIFVAPGLWFATVWCGFHYAIDALLGISIGTICGIIGVAVTEALRCRVPKWDTRYSELYLVSRKSVLRSTKRQRKTYFQLENVDYLSA